MRGFKERCDDKTGVDNVKPQVLFIIVTKITDTFHTVGINSFSMYRY